MRGIDRLLPLHDGAPDVEYNVDVESMELPHIFRTTLAPTMRLFRQESPGAWELVIARVVAELGREL
jgi:hypothetical protein